MLPLGIPRHDFRRPLLGAGRGHKGRSRGAGGGGAASRTPACIKEPTFVLVARRRRFSWETLTDSSLSAALLCDSYHTGPNPRRGASSSPSYTGG